MADDEKKIEEEDAKGQAGRRLSGEDDTEGQRHRGVMIPPSVDAEGDDAQGNVQMRSQGHADLKDEDDMEGHKRA